MDGIVVKEGPVFLIRKRPRVSQDEAKEEDASVPPQATHHMVRKWLLLEDDPATLRVFSKDRADPTAVEEGKLRLYNGFGVGVGQYKTAATKDSTASLQKVIIVSGMYREKQLTCRFTPDGSPGLDEQWRLAIATVLATAPCADRRPTPPVKTAPKRILFGILSGQLVTALTMIKRFVQGVLIAARDRDIPMSVRSGLRMLWLIICFGPLLIGIPIIYALTQFTKWITEVWWAYGLLAVECNGATFIKLAQWAAARRDLFPDEFCERFGKMHSAAPSHSWKDTESILDQSFGINWRKSLEVEKSPIGTGCVAQVHKAVLTRSTGQRQHVAIKVVHPGLHKAVALDLALLSTIARTIEKVSPQTEWLGIKDTCEEFAYLMNSQLDMRDEAENLRKLTANFAKNPHIKFPQPIEGYVKPLVLLETFEVGVPMADFIARGDSRLKRKLAKTGLAAFMQMVFLDNFAHADLHPGNVLVTGDWEDTDEQQETASNSGGQTTVAGNVAVAVAGSVVSVAKNLHGTVSSVFTKKKGALIFLDAGLALTLTNSDRKTFVEIFHAVCTGNGEEVAHLMLERCQSHACQDPQAFAEGISELLSNQPLTLGDFKVGEVLGKLLDLCKQHQVKHFSSFTSVLLATAVMEGVGRSLDPDLDVLMTSLPFVMTARRLVDQEGPEDDGKSSDSCATS